MVRNISIKIQVATDITVLGHVRCSDKQAERKAINLHEDFPNDNIIIIPEHSAKDNGHTVICCLNIPAMRVQHKTYNRNTQAGGALKWTAP